MGRLRLRDERRNLYRRRCHWTIRLCRPLRRWAIEVVARPARHRLPADHRPHLVTRLLMARLRVPRLRRPVLERRHRRVNRHWPRRHRPKRLHRISANDHRRISVAARRLPTHDHRAPPYRNHRHRLRMDRMPRQNRARDRSVSRRRHANVRAAVVSPSPPRRAPAKARRPAPAEPVVEVPRSALVGQISPLVSRNPEVAVTRRPHPVSVAVWVEIGVLRFVGRPYIALSGHVVPVAIGVQIVPLRILVRPHACCRARLVGGFCCQRLVAV